MPGLIPESFIDELLQRADIVDVISARVQLKRTGKEYQARCPFHDERTPSFTVVPQKQFYHCFGCGAHGSALKFLMEYEGLAFPDAVEALAAQVGLKVPRDERRAGQDDQLAPLYGVLAEAAAWFSEELDRSERVQAYLDRRGVDAAMRQRFQLGYAPDRWDGVIARLGKSPERLKLLAGAGLLSQGDGRQYDKFRDRLMFPIHDRRGRPIAFGGRILDAGEPKYLNSPETALFHKGRELYGLWQARQSAQKLKRIVVVEGYMDVIALAQHGVDEVVATLGTATTREHAELLFRNAEDVVYCFDGDRAGRQAAWRALESTLPRLTDGRRAWFLFLPDGEDPDTLVRKEGADGFRARMHAAMPLSDYFFDTLGTEIDLASIDGRARLTARARPLIEQMPDGAFRDLMRKALAERSGAQRVAAPAQPPARPRPAARGPQPRTLVRSALALLLARPQVALEIAVPAGLEGVDKPGADVLRRMLDEVRRRPRITTAELLECFAGDPAHAPLVKLSLQELPGDEPAWREDLESALSRLIEQSDGDRRQYLLARQKSGDTLSSAEKNELRALLARRTQ
ncbi:MAG: DNA primase [Xanthomonadales bacterium]|nr:DNA primase [Xanthomonadales bacterium]